MAQHMQSGAERYGVRRSHDMHQTNVTADHVTVGMRATTHTHKHQRLRRSARSNKAQFYTIRAILVLLCLVLLVTVLAYCYISKKETNNHNGNDEIDDLRSDSDFLTKISRIRRTRVLEFGKDSVGRGQDSRYWDKDDSRRDEDYNEDVMEQNNGGSRNENGSVDKDDALLMMNRNKGSSPNDSHAGLGQRAVGLYNEAGHSELKRYEAKYEASLKKWGNITENDGRTSHDADLDKKNASADIDDDYDDFFDFHDAQVEDYDGSRNMKGEHSNFALKSNDEVHKASLISFDAEIKDDIVAENVEMAFSFNKKLSRHVQPNVPHVSLINEQPITKPPLKTKRKPRRRKFSGLCEMKLSNSTSKHEEPPECQKFVRFNLQYTESEEKPLGEKEWVPRFAGHQSLEQRGKSFLAHDQKINCGFVKGPEGFPSSGFDLAEDDARYIIRCHIAVISCIFGNSDRLRTLTNKTVTGLSRKNVCFVMFIDEVTLQTLTLEGQLPDGMGFIGFWKLVVVKNLPYDDMRRVGKIPKLLPHRLFPSARYSIWLDSKLRLQIDPLLILEYFLWRKGYEFAISNHYDRHCVWEEVARNKKLNKYNHTVIDQQFAFYQADGLQRFNASDPNKLLPSNVPEGSFIIREHTSMSNLFSCLWFNEVDRFTPRDQLSFAYTYQKLRRMNPDRPFHLNMFKDCERRHMAKLFRHRSDEKSSAHGKASE